MSDYIIRGMAADKQVRFFAANTKDLVEKARRIHNTSPLCNSVRAFCTALLSSS